MQWSHESKSGLSHITIVLCPLNYSLPQLCKVPWVPRLQPYLGRQQLSLRKESWSQVLQDKHWSYRQIQLGKAFQTTERACERHRGFSEMSRLETPSLAKQSHCRHQRQAAWIQIPAAVLCRCINQLREDFNFSSLAVKIWIIIGPT